MLSFVLFCFVMYACMYVYIYTYVFMWAIIVIYIYIFIYTIQWGYFDGISCNTWWNINRYNGILWKLSWCGGIFYVVGHAMVKTMLRNVSKPFWADDNCVHSLCYVFLFPIGTLQICFCARGIDLAWREHRPCMQIPESWKTVQCHV